jgi:hypothetical protein
MLCIGFLFFMNCQPAAPPVAAIPYCDIARPVRVSPRDSAATIRRANTEWRKYKHFCRVRGK